MNKFGYEYYLNILAGEKITRLNISDNAQSEKGYRGLYGVFSNDSVLNIFSYLTPDGRSTESIATVRVNIKSRKLMDRKYSAMESDEEKARNAQELEKLLAKKKRGMSRKAVKEANVFLSSYKKMYNIERAEIMPNGTFRIFGEQYSLRIVETTSTNSAGQSSSRTNCYHDYGPGVVMGTDSLGNVSYKATIDYKETFVNYNPGHGANTLGLKDNSYLLFTRDGYSCIDFVNKTYSLKDFKVYGKMNSSKKKRKSSRNYTSVTEDCAIIIHGKKNKLRITSVGI
jgi:hypothetical protein